VDHTALVETFYTAFATGDAEGMVACYHTDIQFKDPAFGALNKDDAKNMWRMLISRSKGAIKISFDSVQANEKTGSANWKAEYIFSQTGRKVINIISAHFEFKDGKIYKHTDDFNIWKWTRQAMGWKGYVLGWTFFMQKKIQQQSGLLLKKYTGKITAAN
jgi:ketosteroid isomerase-like protein